MKIVDRKTFLSLRAGTVYSKYAPCWFQAFEIKEESWTNDFISQSVTDALPYDLDIDKECKLAETQDVPMNFYCTMRDGCFDADQLFAVWSEADVKALIERLTEALADGYQVPDIG